MELSKEHVELKIIQNNIKEKQSDIISILNQDKSEKNQAFEKMTDKQRELNENVSKLQLFIDDWQRQSLIIDRLEKSNEQIKELNEELREENIELKEQLRKIRNKNRGYER
ncbi:hypothetical protein [Sedimentibacter sp. LTW-03]|uniref:hypothetical protein n=1 Tax=Sedimentibacter sp. LTW-03 TaxID=3453406 RepID=UPI003F826DBB